MRTQPQELVRTIKRTNIHITEVHWDIYIYTHTYIWASLMAQWVKNMPARQDIQEMWVQFLIRKIPQRRKWQPSPIFLPEKSHEQRSLVDYSLMGCKESDTTEWLPLTHSPTYLTSVLHLWILLRWRKNLEFTDNRNGMKGPLCPGDAQGHTRSHHWCSAGWLLCHPVTHGCVSLQQAQVSALVLCLSLGRWRIYLIYADPIFFRARFIFWLVANLSLLKSRYSW